MYGYEKPLLILAPFSCCVNADAASTMCDNSRNWCETMLLRCRGRVVCSSPCDSKAELLKTMVDPFIALWHRHFWDAARLSYAQRACMLTCLHRHPGTKDATSWSNALYLEKAFHDHPPYSCSTTRFSLVLSFRVGGGHVGHEEPL